MDMTEREYYNFERSLEDQRREMEIEEELKREYKEKRLRDEADMKKIISMLENCENYIDGMFIWREYDYESDCYIKYDNILEYFAVPGENDVLVYKYYLNKFNNAGFEIPEKAPVYSESLKFIENNSYIMLPDMRSSSGKPTIKATYEKAKKYWEEIFGRKYENRNDDKSWYQEITECDDYCKYDLENKIHRAFLKQKIRQWSDIHDDNILESMLNIICSKDLNLERIFDIIETICIFNKNFIGVKSEYPLCAEFGLENMDYELDNKNTFDLSNNRDNSNSSNSDLIADTEYGAAIWNIKKYGLESDQIENCAQNLTSRQIIKQCFYALKLKELRKKIEEKNKIPF